MVELRTERLVLREWREGDFGAVHAYATDPQTVRFMAFGPNTEEQTREFLVRQIERQGQDPRTDYGLAMTLREGGRLIGGCGIYLRERQGASMGYMLRRDCWNRGYATEAAGALLGLGFEQLGLHRIIAKCDTGNGASARVMEKIGMRREGHFRQSDLVRGEWRDEYLYAMLESEWREKHDGQ